MTPLTCLALWLVATTLGPGVAEPVVLLAEAFGLTADGMTDDGPAIDRLLTAAAQVDGPVVLQFPAGLTVRVETAPERYVFRFDGRADVTLDGGGCTFLLAPALRFLRLTHSRRMTVRNLNLDFFPLPFADGTVAAVDAAAHTIDVRLTDPDQPLPLGGPTKEDGEQAFFGMLWHEGAYGLLSRHYWTARIEPGPDLRTVRVTADERFTEFADLVPGEWRISLPVPGIAHRYGPGACLEVNDNDTVTLEDVELWSAPWFGCHVLRNEGPVVFRRVHIRPKPGSGRLTSTWRDGFHVKGNRGSLLWEDCVLAGMNDDALNLSTHASRVRQLLSPTRVEVIQTFPLGPMPWRVGATLAAADFESRTLVGSATITAVTGWHTDRRVQDKPAASPVTLDLDRPIPGLAEGTMVWEPESANPDTTLRRCDIQMSCRLQSPVALEGCRVTALLWFYGERVEGPFPSRVVLRDCDLRRGRGNARLAVSFSGRPAGATGPPAIHDVRLERNAIRGNVALLGVADAKLVGNRFLEPGAVVRVEGCEGLVAEGNTDAEGRPCL